MIYFDYSNNVLNIYKEACLDDDFANPSSIHYLGMKVNNKINHSRDNILKYLKLNNDYEVIFTSSATEANNLAIIGYCLANKNRGNEIITTHIEHASVLETYKYLEKEHGFVIKYLDIDSSGNFIEEQIDKIVNNKTILITLTPINNVLLCDCSQTLGKYQFNFLDCDLITISSHKIHGLKSISALIKKKKIKLIPLLHGGGQENNLRSSTLDGPIIFSFEEAIKEIMINFNEN